jgi:predicted transglutaminase-like cysteine proteinase
MHARRARLLALAAGLALALGSSCACPDNPRGRYSYFERPQRHDAWSTPIARWQARERRTRAAPQGWQPLRTPAPVALPPVAASPNVEAPSPLRTRYSTFLASQRRRLAREVSGWIQAEAQEWYVEDGPLDVWPAFEETLDATGDDCDGLELLAYNALRQLGFPPEQLFRAILHDVRLGQHHMVTLWFEAPDDPWVIDPTGTVTDHMRRMSEIPHWVPLKIFTETAEYTVGRRR